MPNQDHIDAAADAKEQIEEAGRLVTLYRQDRTPETASQPWLGPDAAPTPPDGATQTAIVCFVPIGGGLGRSMDIPDTFTSGEFSQVGLLAVDSLPGVDLEGYDTLKDSDDRVFTIGRVELLKPGETPILWYLGLKG